MIRALSSCTLLLAACASDPPPAAPPAFTPDAVYAPPQVYTPPASLTPSAGAYPPSGIYAITAKGCASDLPSHVTVLTRARDGHPVGSVPIGKKRLDVPWEGSAALSKMSNTGFALALEGCPTDIEYRLETLVCDSRCDGSVPGMRTADVPAGPAQVQCACP